jgi:uncharacterized DUF497 family protein
MMSIEPTFEWDEAKREAVWQKHGIDFAVAIEIFAGEPAIWRTASDVEERWLAIGEIEGREIAVIFTWREESIRVITARRARIDERRKYHQSLAVRGA